MSGKVHVFAAGSNGIGYVALTDGTTPPNCHIYSVDLVSGQAVRVSNTAFRTPAGLAVDANGNVIVVDAGGVGAPFGIFRVDPTSGTTATVSAGGQVMNPWGVTIEQSGSIIVVDHQKLGGCDPPPPGTITCPGALFRVDPLGGGQSLVTEKDLFHDVAGADLYRGPNVATPTRHSSWGHLKTLYR
jgi:DNA-binding beta-propeller fold protein YncE